LTGTFTNSYLIQTQWATFYIDVINIAIAVIVDAVADLLFRGSGRARPPSKQPVTHLCPYTGTKRVGVLAGALYTVV
jgi:hypothetical protein